MLLKSMENIITVVKASNREALDDDFVHPHYYRVQFSRQHTFDRDELPE